MNGEFPSVCLFTSSYSSSIFLSSSFFLVRPFFLSVAVPTSLLLLFFSRYADKLWNGEGFDFTQDQFYWLVDVSGLMHGLFADRLGGGGAGNDVKGMLFAMTERNSATAPALWTFWDQQRLNTTTMVGWWEDDAPMNVTAVSEGDGSSRVGGSSRVSSSSSSSSGGGVAHNSVVATTYTLFGSHAVVAVSSFAPQHAKNHATVSVTPDWDALGLGVGTAHVSIPAIAGVQAAGAVVRNTDGSVRLSVAGNEGVLLVFEEVKQRT
jgi:hypothetical protein